MVAYIQYDPSCRQHGYPQHKVQEYGQFLRGSFFEAGMMKLRQRTRTNFLQSARVPAPPRNDSSSDRQMHDTMTTNGNGNNAGNARGPQNGSF